MLELLKGKYRCYVSPDRSYLGIEKWTRTKWKVTGEWKEGWKDLGGYYNTLEQILKVYQKNRIMDKLETDDMLTLKQIGEEILNIRNEINDVLSIGKDGLIKSFKLNDIPKNKKIKKNNND
jgi:hypothetical protein